MANPKPKSPPAADAPPSETVKAVALTPLFNGALRIEPGDTLMLSEKAFAELAAMQPPAAELFVEPATPPAA